MRAHLQEIIDERDNLHAMLVSAQTRADRLESETVLKIQVRAAAAAAAQKEKEQPTKEKEEETEEPERRLPSSPEVSGPVNWWEFTF
jgi:hypothetical protein